MLDTIPNTNTDCRKFKKNWGSNKENERDFQDWLYTHATEYRFQNIIRKKYLYNYYPVQVRDLCSALRRDFFLDFGKLDKIISHLINNNDTLKSIGSIRITNASFTCILFLVFL